MELRAEKTHSRGDLGAVMREFTRSVTRTVNRETGRSGHLFTGRYKATLIDSPAYQATLDRWGLGAGAISESQIVG